MRKTAALTAIALVLSALTACGMPAERPAAASATLLTPAGTATPAPSTLPPATPTATPDPTPAPTEPGVLPQSAYDGFLKAGFSAKAGDASVIAKWTGQIRVQAAGKPGVEDRRALSSLIDNIRSVAGMPEVLLVTEGGNFIVGFVPEKKGKTVFNTYESGAQGVARLGGKAEFAAAVIPDEMQGQPERSGSLARLMLTGLGLAADGALSGGVLGSAGGVEEPTQSDWLMLKLLYCPSLSPGMTPEEAIPLVRSYDPGSYAPGSANDPGIGRLEQLEYFNEVGFYWTESSSDGITSKWARKIKVQVSGSPTQAQMELLDGYLPGIAGVKGFPGFENVQSGGELVFSCKTTAELKKDFPQMTEKESCYISVSRSKGVIAKCVIGVSTDFPDETVMRNQFLRLLMRALGFSATSGEYPDSVFNPVSSAQDWSGLDWKMVGLLYRQDIKAGERRAAVMKRLMNED